LAKYLNLAQEPEYSEHQLSDLGLIIYKKPLIILDMNNKKVHMLKHITGKPFDKVIMKESKVLSLLTIDEN